MELVMPFKENEQVIEEIVDVIGKALDQYTIRDIEIACRQIADKMATIQREDVSNISPIFEPLANIPMGLRNIAFGIDNAKYPIADCLTLVYGYQVFHLGTPGAHSAEAAANAVFDLELGKAKLINAALQGDGNGSE